MELRPFESGSAEQISAWAITAEEALAWCSHPTAPVPAAVVAGWSSGADVHAYVLRSSERVIGYGELWVDDDEQEVELSRLIVDPDRRGQGIGGELVTALTANARTWHQQVFLRVRPDNLRAQRCYLGAGFERLAPETEAEWNQGQPMAYVWMVAS